jgi:histidine ammonia-lyase
MALTHRFGDGPLTVARLYELSQSPVQGEFSPRALERMARGRGIVERTLASGTPVYGATTGIGSQKDVAVGPHAVADFGNRMIVSEATNARGPAFADCVVRGALIVLCNNLAYGRSGIRPVLGRALLDLLAGRALPEVRRDCAFGVADLTPLSQLALPLIGRALHDTDAAPAAGLTLAPKESVSLIDNNSFALADAALMLHDARELLRSFDLAAAIACEGFRAGLEPHTRSGGTAGAGESASRANLLGLLTGSALHAPGAARLLQDPLSFRGITQIHGAAYETLDWATRQVEAEINAAVDNPLVDLDRETLCVSASMISVLPVLAIDSLRQALAKVTVTSHERSLKLQSPAFSGLPVGLAADGAADGGILSLNLHYIGAARLGTLCATAAPVLLTYIGHTADGVEDVSTLLPLSVTQTRDLIARAFELAVLEMIVAVWAIARRGLAPSALGRGPRVVHDALLPLLHIGEEGVRLFDFAAIVTRVQESRLVEAAFAA